MTGLVVEVSEASIPEDGGTTTVTVRRTDDFTEFETIRLVPDELEVEVDPPFFLLSPGEAEAVFRVDSIDNFVADRDREVTLTATSDLATRDSGSATVTIENDESFAFTLSFFTNFLSESSGSLGASIFLNSQNAEIVSFNVQFDVPGRVSVPLLIEVDAGAGSTFFTITGINDSVFNGDQTITATITTGAFGYNAFSSSASFVLLDDDLIRGTVGDDVLVGTPDDDVLDGNTGNDLLNGGAGDDTMIGGAGDDQFQVDSLGDVVTEAAGEGYDRILTSISLTLADNVEAGNLLGGDDLNMVGNTENNWLNGNSGNNLLVGGTGNDRLDGNAGNDTLIGGEGNDILEGGLGTDIFVVEQNAGVDRILDFELGVDLIDITATGLGFTDLQITEVNGDALITYDSNPVVGVLRLDGIAAADLSAADFIEPIGAPLDIVGTAGNDVLFGSDASETLLGLDGNDRLIGLQGDDVFNGGDGNDTFDVNSAGDTIIEGNGANSGYDRALVYSDSIAGSLHVMADNVEAATVLGNAIFQVNGNASDNWIVGNNAVNALNGNTGNDRLEGRSGNDLLDGGAGNDVLEGGIGRDTFLFNRDDGVDLILDYNPFDDNLLLLGVSRFSVSVDQVGSNVVITYDDDDIITIRNQSIVDFDVNGSEFEFF